MTIRSVFACLAAAIGALVVDPSLLDAAELSETELRGSLAAVRAVGPRGAGHRAAAEGVKRLAGADASQLPAILAAMRDVDDVAANWLRGVAESVAQRSQQRGQKLPVNQLETFLGDVQQSPKGRRLAFELIASVDDTAQARLIPQMLDDPSLELRRDAVAYELGRAASLADDKPKAVAAYQKAFQSARDLDQIKESAAKLKELGHPADIAAQMGFLSKWKLIGPFDNVAEVGWDAAYPPEKAVDFQAEYDGKAGRVKWIDHTTKDEYGVVDLNEAIGKHKGAVAYAAAEFIADGPQAVDIRVGSLTAVKVWVNGKQIDERHVYHSGTSVDQYVSRAVLKPGKNIILVKICQNEQTDSWAQGWTFQLRVCDSIGMAVHSLDRTSEKSAER